jgi:hypothetical protein
MATYAAPKIGNTGSVTESTCAAGLGVGDPKNPLILGLDPIGIFGF